MTGLGPARERHRTDASDAHLLGDGRREFHKHHVYHPGGTKLGFGHVHLDLPSRHDGTHRIGAELLAGSDLAGAPTVLSLHRSSSAPSPLLCRQTEHRIRPSNSRWRMRSALPRSRRPTSRSASLLRRPKLLALRDAVIPAGQTFAIVNVTAGILQGKANVTALVSCLIVHNWLCKFVGEPFHGHPGSIRPLRNRAQC